MIRTRRKCQWSIIRDDNGNNIRDVRCRSCALEYDRDMDAFRCVNCGGVRQVCFAKMVERYQHFGNLRSTITASNAPTALSAGSQIADAAEKYFKESWRSAMGLPATSPGPGITPEQVQSAQYLETLGKQFLVDFGYGNCEQMAFKHMAAQLADLKKDTQ